MQSLIKFILLFLQNLYLVSTSTIGSLKLVSVVYRHGDRTPIDVFPTDPYKASFWKEGLGQLTSTGMRQHYNLGQYLRKRYSGFLNESYLKDEIVIRSTDYDRTLMSAYSDLAGLYPPKGYQVWNPSIPWQPIPVHTVPLEEDHLLHTSTCPLYDKLWKELLNSKMVKDEEERNKEFYKMIAKYTGVATETIDTVWKIYDTLFIEKTHNLTLPSWCTDQVFSKLTNISRWEFGLKGYYREMQKLRAGEWIYKVTSDMQKKINGTMDPKNRKIFMYSAHDDTVSVFLQAMGAYNYVQPPYAAALMLELHQSPGGAPFIQLYYRNDSTKDPYLLTMKGCTTECPLPTFIALTADVSCPNVVPICNEQTKKCMLSNSLQRMFSVDDLMIYAGVAGIGCSVVIILVIFIMVIRRKNVAYQRLVMNNE